MRVCNATCLKCDKRFYAYGSELAIDWNLCPWCRFKLYFRLYGWEAAGYVGRGLAIGAGFFLAGLIVRLFFVPEAWR